MAANTDRIYGYSGDLAVKSPVVAATSANITLYGLQTIGVTVLAAGDRVLVRSQTNPVENGIYIANTSTWRRAADFDGARDVVDGTLVIAKFGTNMGLIYQANSSAVPVIPGTSEITFSALVNPLTIYDVTEDEALAGVTIVDYAYPHGDVRRYGAVGDGVNNDSTAFQRALDSNNVVYVPSPPSKYLFNSEVTWPGGKPLAVRGAVRGWTVGGVPAGGVCIELAAAAGVGAACFACDGTGTDMAINPDISGILFLLKNSGATNLAHRAIRFRETLGGEIHRNRCEGSGLASDDSAFMELDDATLGTPAGTFTGALNIVFNYLTNMRYGIILRDNCTSVRITHNEIYGNNPSLASLAGIYTETLVVGATIAFNYIQGWVKGVHDQGVANILAHNTFEANTGAGYTDLNSVTYDRSTASLPRGYDNAIVSGGAPLLTFNNSAATSDTRPRNFRIDDAYGEFGRGFREWNRLNNLGEFNAIAWVPTYSSNTGVMTLSAVTVTRAKFSLVGHRMRVDVFIDFTIGGTPESQIWINLPAGYKAVGDVRALIHVFNNGAYETGLARVQVDDTKIRVFKDKTMAGSWTAGAGTISGPFEFEVAEV